MGCTLAQVYASLGGKVAADFGLGEARPGVPMTADTLMLWQSAGKPITAVAIMQQVERGKLALEDPVARHIPEFAEHGKGDITVWHLLTHTAGLRLISIDWQGPWQETIARLSACRPSATGGQANGPDTTPARAGTSWVNWCAARTVAISPSMCARRFFGRSR